MRTEYHSLIAKPAYPVVAFKVVLLSSFCHFSFLAQSDITQLLDVPWSFWEGFDLGSIWLMGAAGFLFVIWECLEHVTEHECALVA